MGRKNEVWFVASFGEECKVREEERKRKGAHWMGRWEGGDGVDLPVKQLTRWSVAAGPR